MFITTLEQLREFENSIRKRVEKLSEEDKKLILEQLKGDYNAGS